MNTMKTPLKMNIQLFAETGVNFEEILTKHAGEDGSIPADAIAKAANAISSAVGRAFVTKDRYTAKLDEIDKLTNEKNTAEDELTKAKKFEERYTNEHEAFEKYKTENDAKNTLAAVKEAYKALLGEANIDPKRHDAIIRATSFDDKKLGADGKLENADALKQGIEKEWADFKVSTTTKGATVETPPANNGKAKRSVDEIMAIKDTAERQRAIAENHELFGF